MPNLPTIPQEYFCPITMDVMEDPVSGNQGEVFERSAITPWVTEHHCSPITRQPLELRDLRPNLPLKSLIEDFMAKRDQLQLATPVPPVNKSALKHFPVISPELEAVCVGNIMKCSIHFPEAKLAEIKQTVPCDIVADVDVSCSMDGSSSRNNVEGGAWSILSLVQHSLITTIKGMNEYCRFAIVTFSSISKLRLPPLYMTEENKKKAIAMVNLLCTEGNTNLYAGITKSYEVIKNYNLTNNPTILTFTDGISNNDPPSGVIKAVQKYKDEGNMKGTMHVIGFGSDLKTMDLFSIADITGGRFDYISDFSMVGTVFVNMLTNTLLTAAIGDKFEIVCPTNLFGYELNSMVEVCCPHKKQDNIITIDTQAVLYGQTRDFFLEFTNPLTKENAPTVLYKSQRNPRLSTVNVPTTEMPDITTKEEMKKLKTFMSRLLIAKTYTELVSTKNENSESRKASVQDFMRKLRQDPEKLSVIKDGDVYKNLMMDLENEILQGFSSPETYRLWGQKYACAYIKALEFQQSNNFKDKIMTHFTSDYSDKIKEDIEAIFMAIEPPKTRQNRVVDRKTFTNVSYNCGGGCVSWDTPLVIRRGERICNVVASKVQPGDMVLTFDHHIYNFTPVIFVVIQNSDSYMIEMPNNIKITPWHPMFNENEHKYVFPEDCKQGKRVEYCEDLKTVYNFVVQNRKSIVVGDKWLHNLVSDDESNERDIVTMISLGHGITDDEVAKHDYLGTEKVVHDLYKLREEQGTNRVLVSNEERDPDTNLIVKYL